MASQGDTTTDQCCPKCPSQRNVCEFNKYHLKIITPPVDESTCLLCLEPYGLRNLANGHLDVACQVVGLQCSHVFGYACLRELFTSGIAHCPICRREWYSRPKHDSTDTPKQRDYAAQKLARMFRIDITTARCYIYEEEEYFDRAMPRLLDWVDEEQEEFATIVDIVDSLGVKSVIIELQNSSANNQIDDKLFNPLTGSLELYASDYFHSHPWHLQTPVLALLIYRTLGSFNGIRLEDMFEYKLDMECLELASKEKSKKEFLAELENKWVGWYGDEEVRSFSRIVVNVLWELYRVEELIKELEEEGI